MNAFDVKELVERLKVKGIPLAEDVVQDLTKEIFAWAGESCALKGGFFAVAVPLLPLVLAQVVAAEDKLDGKAD